MQSSLNGFGRGARTPVELVSQPPSHLPCRQTTVAWFPSFGGRSFNHGWNSISRINKPFALGIGAGTGGSLLVSIAALSLAPAFDNHAASLPTDTCLQYSGGGPAHLGGLWPFRSKGETHASIA